MNSKQTEKQIQQSSTTLILFDSNVHIKNNYNSRILSAFSGKMKRYSASLVLPNIVLREVMKITKISENEVLGKISRVYNRVLFSENNNEISLEAKRLETHFFECHRADSIILATAKIMGAVLVTFDRKLLQTAKLEGVQAYGVKEFLKHWRVQN